MDNSVPMIVLCLLIVLILSSWQWLLAFLIVGGVIALAILQYREAKGKGWHKHKWEMTDFSKGVHYWKCSKCGVREVH